MKVLFLDIDGVLNCVTTRGSCRKRLEPTMIARLDDLLERTGAMVVISSCWRAGDGGELVSLNLCTYGFRHPERIIGETGWHADGRGFEIGDWLYAHPEVDTFAIVDDELWDIHGLLRQRAVQTTYQRGLTEVEVERLVGLLGEMPATRSDQ